MHKHAHVCWRIGAPLILAFVLLFVVAPATFAASYGQNNSSKKHPASLPLVGPKSHYLAIGDSLAFGFQPDLNFDDGYVNDYYADLQGHGVTSMANLSCPGETSVTFLNGKCPYPYLRKFPYLGSQLNAALAYLHVYAGQVSPVTFDIGANDIKGDINLSTCVIDTAKFQSDLATLDANLTQTILPQLHQALMVNGQLTGDLVMMNYYDPYQNICPNSVPLTQLVNQHLAADISGYGSIVDVFSAFGGPTTPNSNICTYTWMCTIFKDIHSTDEGYSVIANTFEQGTGY